MKMIKNISSRQGDMDSVFVSVFDILILNWIRQQSI